MKNFRQIAAGVDVSSLMLELQRHPELWDKNPCRQSINGPHHEQSDIIVRYKDETPNIKTGDFSDFGDEHIPVWYKSADFLPSVRKLVFDLMGFVNGELLGGVLIYKLPPGKQIYRHTDRGWHAESFEKFNICLQSNPAAGFCYEGEAMVQRAGDIHWFRNTVDHWVVNQGTDDHIIMTVCILLDNNVRAPWSPEGWTIDTRLIERK
jgi:hypothetical protein